MDQSASRPPDGRSDDVTDERFDDVDDPTVDDPIVDDDEAEGELDDDELDDDGPADDELDEGEFDEGEFDEDDAPDEPADQPVDRGDDVHDEHEETDFATVATGPTVEAAKRKALEQLRKVVPYVREDDVEFVVDEGGRGGFFGMGKSQPRVEARVVSGGGEGPGDAVDLREASARLGEFVSHVAEGLGLDVEVDVSVTGDALVAEVAGGDLGLLIGRHGQTLDALQYLAAIVVNGHSHARRQVIVDAEGYRGRREVSIRAVADRAAQKVERTRNEVTLKPMTAAERKIVHLYLKDHPKVETRSEGDEPQRSVIISPKRR